MSDLGNDQQAPDPFEPPTRGGPTRARHRLMFGGVLVAVTAVVVAFVAGTDPAENVDVRSTPAVAERTTVPEPPTVPEPSTVPEPATVPERTTVPGSSGGTAKGPLHLTVRRSKVSSRPGRLTANDLATDFIPIPGVDPGVSCSVTGTLSVTVTGPKGPPWTETYTEYADRVIGYLEGPNPDVGSAPGTPSSQPAGLYDVAVVSGLAKDQRVTVTSFEGADVAAVRASGVTVLARYAAPAEPGVGLPHLVDLSPAGNARSERPLPPLITWVRRPQGSTVPRYDPNCNTRRYYKADGAASPAQRDVVVAAMGQVLGKLAGGDFSGIDPALGVPALGDTSAEVEEVLAAARSRALASPLAQYLPEVVTNVGRTSVVGGVIVAEVSLGHPSVGNTMIVVDLHQDQATGVWRFSPQSLCSALVQLQTPCAPAS